MFRQWQAGSACIPGGRKRTHKSNRRSRRGAVVVLMAVLLTVLLGMIAFAVDVGYMLTARTELQCAADAAALAGVGAMRNADEDVQTVVHQYINANLPAGRAIPPEDITFEEGIWDDQTRVFSSGGRYPSALRLQVQIADHPLFFGRVLGQQSFETQAEAIAMYMPRDIMVVLDYSGSMNDDSELKQVGRLPQADIEANLYEIYQQLGSPVFGSMQWQPQYISSNRTSTIKRTLGLDRVPYPYPSGSWSDYISYVKSSGSLRHDGINYRKKYGYLTLVNYWLERRPKHNQTPDLWQTSEQPITAVKDAVTVLLADILDMRADDRVGLSVYTSANGAAVLESPLTDDLGLIEQTSRQRQAGHYDVYTNIGAGMQVARQQMTSNARHSAFKMIVLMTDGMANRPSGYANQFVLDEAQRCADAGYPIMTISLGAGADTSLMQQVADITDGVHFNIPGGQSVSAYEAQLQEVFHDIAAHRPLRIVN